MRVKERPGEEIVCAFGRFIATLFMFLKTI